MTTRIRGIDFTSAPKASKPITLAEGELKADVLQIQVLRPLASFGAFEEVLRDSGPWVAGIDFPFGQPRRLLEDLGWPREAWSRYVAHVEKLGKEEFEKTITAYSARRPYGDKEHKRATDPSDAISPMRLKFQPVGKMFFQGSPRILASGASVVPCAPGKSERVVVEAYPAQAVKTLMGSKISYKHDAKAKQNAAHRRARQQLISQLSGASSSERYGLAVQLDQPLRVRLIEDPTADLLDAVLCALQAAWASRQPGYGVPLDCDALEGWIVDPALLPD